MCMWASLIRKEKKRKEIAEIRLSIPITPIIDILFSFFELYLYTVVREKTKQNFLKTSDQWFTAKN